MRRSLFTHASSAALFLSNRARPFARAPCVDTRTARDIPTEANGEEQRAALWVRGVDWMRYVLGVGRPGPVARALPVRDATEAQAQGADGELASHRRVSCECETRATRPRNARAQTLPGQGVGTWRASFQRPASFFPFRPSPYPYSCPPPTSFLPPSPCLQDPVFGRNENAAATRALVFSSPHHPRPSLAIPPVLHPDPCSLRFRAPKLSRLPGAGFQNSSEDGRGGDPSTAMNTIVGMW
jgi:hypothetical protein